jgi:hypothetical protein
VARRKAQLALARACDRIVNAPVGDRDNIRHAMCFHVGGIIANGDIGYEEAYPLLLAAARAVAHHPPWRDLGGINCRVARSLEAGMRHPLPLDPAELWLRELRSRLAARRAAP